ncbi:NUDIX domain-containing protein [Bradyrhizobium sp. 177]|uniref:NUDIX domain-containing protein n=1 Tax=Bradyrhizobium sp. 177 TaxID=2782647 RepID=UPI001FF74EF8|nr:NUDIX domain-containing protein [Bradyrhizobium sp. 177]
MAPSFAHRVVAIGGEIEFGESWQAALVRKFHEELGIGNLHREGDELNTLLLPHRHCERGQAIQNPSAETVWIASLRSR